MSESQSSTSAERAQRHRVGVATQLREIKASLDELRRDFQLAIIQRQINAGLQTRDRAASER